MSWRNLSTLNLSRRKFLKFSGLSLIGLLLPESSSFAMDRPVIQQGRVLDALIHIYDKPSFSANRLKYYWRDLIVPITDVVIGEEKSDFSRIWYRIGDEGYTHAGGIQPVQITLNAPSNDIPSYGRLTEISVPYTDTIWDLNKPREIAYRLYFETTHWVTGLYFDSNNAPWYQILDDKWQTIYYANATHVRMVTPDEITPLSPEIPLNEKRIEIHLQKQIVVAYEGDQPVYMALTSTGAKFSTGNYTTPIGDYITNFKRPYRHMAAGDRAAANSYDLPGVPWVCYFTEDGISLHGTYWHNDFGQPRSHGCINLTAQSAKWFYRWTLPYVPFHEHRVFEKYGTLVRVLDI